MFNSNREFTHRAQQDAIRSASSYAHFSQNQSLYQNKAVGSALSAYQWALADYFGMPEVEEIDVSGWTGEVGQSIVIRARDNLMVLHVDVMISEGSEGNSVFESGDAEQSDTDRSLWIYTTSTAVPQKPGVCVDVVAYDLPGNSGESCLKLE